MSNMFVLKTNIFEAQAGVVNLFCRTTQSRPCSFCMFLSIFLIFSAQTVVVVFQHSTSSEADLISDSSILGHKTSTFFTCQTLFLYL